VVKPGVSRGLNIPRGRVADHYGTAQMPSSKTLSQSDLDLLEAIEESYRPI
jgi:hypothetical protein